MRRSTVPSRVDKQALPTFPPPLCRWGREGCGSHPEQVVARYWSGDGCRLGHRPRSRPVVRRNAGADFVGRQHPHASSSPNFVGVAAQDENHTRREPFSPFGTVHGLSCPLSS